MNPGVFFFGFTFGEGVILAPEFFIKSSENNTPIDSYHAPGGFCKTSTPAAVVTPYCDRPECRSHHHEKECLEIIVTFFIPVFVTYFF